jgi:hypothetical protein
LRVIFTRISRSRSQAEPSPITFTAYHGELRGYCCAAEQFSVTKYLRDVKEAFSLKQECSDIFAAFRRQALLQIAPPLLRDFVNTLENKLTIMIIMHLLKYNNNNTCPSYTIFIKWNNVERAATEGSGGNSVAGTTLSWEGSSRFGELASELATLESCLSKVTAVMGGAVWAGGLARSLGLRAKDG